MRVCAALCSLSPIAVASAALAHVTMSSTDARAGGFGKLVFRVPTESDTASTMSVTVALPDKTPFAFVSTKAKPGWTATIRETTHPKPITVGGFDVTKTVRAVTWTAKGAGIKPGQFDEFELSAGPMPAAKSLSFTVKQAYSDDTTVNWDQVQSGKSEPEHPAPTLNLIEAAPKAEKSTDFSSRGLSLAALAIAAAGYLLGTRNNRRHA